MAEPDNRLVHNHPPPYYLDGSTCPAGCPVPVAGTLPSPPEMSPGTRAKYDAAVAEERQRDTLAAQLEAWWFIQAQREAQMVVPKAVEYSATDLTDLGRQIAALADWHDITDGEAAELGIAFYVAGKVGRVMGAVKAKRLPSADTWLDIGIYSRMAQRVREVGSWPGV